MSIFSTAKQYFAFPGVNASLRTKNALPIFDFSADAGLNVETAIYLIRFDKESDRRQVRVAKA